MNKPTIKTDPKSKRDHELVDAMEKELTDEQLLQMAEGSSSWGAHCNSNCH
jgi:hypothetical protein